FMMKHLIKPGETLTSIARDYRITVQSIVAANPGINPNVIYAGQTITIPGFPPIETIPFRIQVSQSNRTLTLIKNNTVVKRYPIAVGRMLHQTPVGDFII